MTGLQVETLCFLSPRKVQLPMLVSELQPFQPPMCMGSGSFMGSIRTYILFLIWHVHSQSPPYKSVLTQGARHLEACSTWKWWFSFFFFFFKDVLSLLCVIIVIGWLISLSPSAYHCFLLASFSLVSLSRLHLSLWSYVQVPKDILFYHPGSRRTQPFEGWALLMHSGQHLFARASLWEFWGVFLVLLGQFPLLLISLPKNVPVSYDLPAPCSYHFALKQIHLQGFQRWLIC